MHIALPKLRFGFLGRCQLAQFRVPFRLQDLSDQAIVRIDPQIAALGQIGFVLGAFNLQMPQALGVFRPLDHFLLQGCNERQ